MATLTIKKVGKNDCAKIQQWVSAWPEKTGSVIETPKSLKFVDDNNNTGLVSFHTHPLTNKQGGYQPPSVTDLQVLLNGALRGVVERHYVLCNAGMYVISLKCNLSRAAYIRLKARVESLHKSLRPSQKFHSVWMQRVNGTCPKCCNVKFVPWECIGQ